MKTLVSLFLVVFFVSSCCESRVEQSNFKTCFKPGDETVRELYLLDTITIKDPLLVIYKDSLFVIRESYLAQFVDNPSLRDEGSGQQVFYIIPGYLRTHSLDPSNILHNGEDLTNRVRNQLGFARKICLYDWRNYSECVLFREITGMVEVYSFEPKPSKFALELVIEPVDRDAYISDEHEIHARLKENYQQYLCKKTGNYLNKLDSLENRVVTNNKPRFVLTVEPLYSRETINKFIEEEGILIGNPGEERPYPKLPKRVVKKKGLPDL